MPPSEAFWLLALLIVAGMALALAHNWVRRSEWPTRAFKDMSQLRLDMEALEKSWATTKVHLVDQLEAIDDVCARIETKRKQVTVSERRSERRSAMREQVEPVEVPQEPLDPLAEAQSYWAARKKSRA